MRRINGWSRNASRSAAWRSAAAAERICKAGLARSRDAGDLWTQARLLIRMAILDEQAGRASDAAAYLREGLQIAGRTGGGFELLNGPTLVAHGRTDAQIAAQLFISVRTVSTHLDRVRDKTGCRRRADLTRLALNAGLA